MDAETLFATPHAPFSGLDISSKAFWGKTFVERERTFAELRSTDPVSWNPPTEWYEDHAQQGFWAVTRAADIAAVSLNPAVFRSGYGTTMDPVDPGISAPATFILSMDAPRHSHLRRLISAAFTPKAVARLAEQIERRSERIAQDLVGAGAIDFVRDCASRLPMATISDLIGVPDADRERVGLAAERLLGGADMPGRPADEVLAILAGEFDLLTSTGRDLAAHRRAHPADDLMTNMVRAEIDGQGLSDEDIGSFFVLLSVAGNDTSRQTISMGMLALQDHPAERAWLLADLDARIGTAVEEIARWVSPIIQMSRTAAQDVELGGRAIAAGDKVVMFYCSANRDEERFADPLRFDLGRSTNPHLAFGAGGPHFCLGHTLARTQVRTLVTQVLRHVPGIEFGTPELMDSNVIHGASALPAFVA